MKRCCHEGVATGPRAGDASAARGVGEWESLSEFIRQAAAQRADAVLSTEDPDDFADILGVVHGGGGRARRTGSAFKDILVDGRRDE